MHNLTKLLLCGSVAAVAGCGSAAASSSPASAATPGAGARAGAGGAAGQLVQVNGSTLTLSTTSGDVSVVYTTSTTITSTSTGSTGDIVAGTCVVIVGQKDSTGLVTATSVRLSQAVNGSCAAAGAGRGGFPGGTPPSFSPRASARPSGAPTLNPNTAFVSGLVTVVSGEVVTVQASTGSTSSVTVPTTLSVTESSSGTAADLTVDSCVRAVGPKDSSGAVQARALTIQPTGATGACTFGGAGGFGGRFGGGGGGGFGGGAAPTTAA
jgi:hypothetical protein